MANPPSRRTSSSYSINTHHYQLPISDSSTNPFQSQTPTTATRFSTLLNSLKFFLKKPHAFPFLLSIFLFLTWVSLRFQYNNNPTSSSSTSSSSSSSKSDFNSMATLHHDTNLVGFHSLSSDIAKDKRGWLIDPVSLALQSGISGGALSCNSVHIGEIHPGGMRGNHRHHSCNETFVIWGAKTIFREWFKFSKREEIIFRRTERRNRGSKELNKRIDGIVKTS